MVVILESIKCSSGCVNSGINAIGNGNDNSMSSINRINSINSDNGNCNYIILMGQDCQ